MASTGEYWKPVYNLLEGTCTVCLVNAAHVKNVPGRKTARADRRWLATLMRDGWLHELGATDFDGHQREHLVARLTRRLEHLGYRVSLEPVPAV